MATKRKPANGKKNGHGHLMDASDLMDTPRRCSAKAKQSGEQCKRLPHPGATVCVIHGAGAKHVQDSARQRLEALVDPAIGALRKAIDEGEIRDIVKAAQIVLDRCGFHPTQRVELDAELRVVRPERPDDPETARKMLKEACGESY